MQKLIISLPGGGESAAFELTDDVVTVGRLDDNAIAIRDGSVSSHHAELVLRGDDYVLKDIGSTNGTTINGRPATEQALRNGDRVVFGNIEAVYESSTPSASQPLPAAEAVAAELGSNSQRPAEFANESPFKKKAGEADPVGRAIMGFAIAAVVAFCVAVVMILTLQPPA